MGGSGLRGTNNKVASGNLGILESKSGNLGEWSELYALGYLLVNHGAHGADELQSPIETVFYEVLKINLNIGDLEQQIYVLDNDQVKFKSIYKSESTVELKELSAAVNRLYLDLVKGDNKGTFPLESGSKLAEILGRSAISANSSQRTSDLELVLRDSDSSIGQPPVGFSVKSQLGSPSTLLNASGSTNFIFEIDESAADCSFSDLDLSEKALQSNIALLKMHGFKLKYINMDSKQFENNLKLIDSFMVENVAEILTTFYSSKLSKFSDVAKQAFPENETNSQQKIFKLKQFLGAIAMGMRPSSPWDGDVTKFKGLILVKENGEVVIYYLDNLSGFQDYLFENLKFEVASTTRHKFGKFYVRDGCVYIKLNLQIRFTK